MTTDLQVTTNKVSDVQTQLTVKVPVKQIQSKVEARLRHIAKTAKIDGFRRGKIPLSFVRNQYGAGVQQEIINDEIRVTIRQALESEDIRSVGTPNIDDVKVEDDFLVYQATVETFPDVEIKGLSEIDVERHYANVSDDDVDTLIENLRKTRATFTPKEGEVEESDQVTIDFEGSIDGEKFEGGSAEDSKIVIGSNQMIPGFEDGIKGMKADEEKIIEVTFPDDYQAENLAGKEAQFKIKVKQVEAEQLPELNEDFFKEFGIEEGGLEKLKKEVRKNMEREIKNAARNQIKQAVFDVLLEYNEFDIPHAILEQEINRQRQLMIQRFAQQFGANPNMLSKDNLPDELFEEQALRAVRLGIMVSQLTKEQNLEVDQERVKTFIEEAAENYEDPEDVIEYYTNDKQQRENIESVILEDQVVDYLLSQGKVTDKEVSYQELLAAQQQMA